MSQPRPIVAIIGTGFAGLALALALHQQQITCTLYESRSGPLNLGGAVMLSPNALKVLSALGVYDRLQSKGYNFSTLVFRDASGQETETQEFGGKEKYGFDALRIYRYELIDELLLIIKEKGVKIEFGKKFVRVFEENVHGVKWEFADGTQGSASLLVGADGIHSTVRKYLYPDIEPIFTGMSGITAAVPTSQLKLPAGFHIPVTFTSGQGAFVIAPQKPDGSEVLIGKQRITEDRDRVGWTDLLANKEDLVKFLQQDSELYPQIVANAVSHIPHDKINVWPFYLVPKLDRWASAQCRVIILGDAAHAIPPTAGQGINQAFEDVYMFALLLGQAEKIKIEDGLVFWQTYRQDRVDKVLKLNEQINRRRVPGLKRNSDDKLHLGWLYEPDFEAVVNSWIAEHEQGME